MTIASVLVPRHLIKCNDKSNGIYFGDFSDMIGKKEIMMVVMKMIMLLISDVNITTTHQ